ncbi:TPA: hypothetical protein U1312_001052 [Streptococcus suis]|nr:hypothetical protein [Streptococcus suis]
MQINLEKIAWAVFFFSKKSENGRREGIRKQINYLYSMKIKSSLGNEAEDRTGVHQGS